MKSRQEQIEEIIEILLEASTKCFTSDCDCCEKQYEKDCAQYNKATALIDAGYGDVSEYKAERKMLGSQIKTLKQRLNNKYVEIGELKADLDHQIDATNDAENLADHLQYEYDKCFKRLKSTQKELNELKDKLKSVAHVEPIKDVVIIKRCDFDNIVEAQTNETV